MKSLFKAVALITFFSVLTRAAGFFFRIYLSRTIGAEALGIYQISLSVFFVLATVVSSGIPLIISRNTAKYITLKDKASEKRMMGSSLVLTAILSLIVCAFVLIFKDVFSFLFTDKRCYPILLLFLPAVLFTGIFGAFKGYLWGKNNYFGVCISEFIEQIVRIILCVIALSLIFTNIDGATIAASTLTIACAVSALASMIFFFSTGGRIGKPQKMFKELIKPSTSVTIFRMVTSLVQPLIAIIIPFRLVEAGYTSTQAISLFGIAIGMTLPLLFIPSAIVGSLSMALIPDLSTAMTKHDNVHIEKRISTSLALTMFFSTFFVPLFIGAGEQIGTFFYDNTQSGILLAQSAWLIIPLGLVNVTSSILNAIGLETKSLRNYVLGAIFLLLSIWFLPKYIGINSLIWGMGLCMIIASVLNIRMLKKHTKAHLHFLKPFFLMLAFILPVTAITSFTTNVLTNFFSLFFSLAISCTLGAICFVALCLIFNVIELQTIFIKFLPKRNEKTGKFKLNFSFFKKLKFFSFSSFKIKSKKKKQEIVWQAVKKPEN